MVGVGAVFVASVGLAAVHPWGDVRNGDANAQILEGAALPASVRVTIDAKCADCHSNRTHWPVYSRLAPASWLMEHDVFAARSAMNLSQWRGMPVEGRIAALTRIAAEARSGQMPPRQYTFMHPAARLTSGEQQQIAAWARAERKRLKAGEGKESSEQ